MPHPDQNVRPALSRRRSFSAEFKLRVLEELDCSLDPDHRRRVMERYGLTHSHVSNWRRALKRGVRQGLEPRQAGRPKRHPLEERVRELERECEALRAHVGQLSLINESLRELAVAHGLSACEDRERYLLAADALGREIGTAEACRALGVSRATVYRRRAKRVENKP